MVIAGIRCPYLRAAKQGGTRVCLVCACGEGGEKVTQVEQETLELFLACNCRRDKASAALCPLRFVWESAQLRDPAPSLPALSVRRRTPPRRLPAGWSKDEQRERQTPAASDVLLLAQTF